MDPNRESENDNSSEFDPLQDVLATAHHKHQVHDWLMDAEEPAERYEPELASEMSPNLIA